MDINMDINMELKKVFQEFDKSFQDSKQLIRDEINDFCNSQQPVDHTLTTDDPSPVTQNINDKICGDDINRRNGQFCNYDDGYEGKTGTYESCDDHKDAISCENAGLPDKGALDCKKRCFNDTTPLKPKLPNCTISQVKSFITKTKSDFLSIDQMCGNIKVDNVKCKIDMRNVPTCRDALDKCETQRCRDVIQECKPPESCMTNDFYKLDTVTNKICRRERSINKCNSDDLLKHFNSNVPESNCPLVHKAIIYDDKNYKYSYCDLNQNFDESKKCSEGTKSGKDVICKGGFCFNTKTKKLCRDE